MTGLKSGSGDDLWGDSEENDETAEGHTPSETNGNDETSADSSPPGQSTADSESSLVSNDTEESTTDEHSKSPSSGTGQGHPYIVRRALQDKSIQFERDERLTFFVHGDVVDGERELISDVETTLGRDVPKFDVREAVYRAALRNPEDVLDELLRMGYTTDEGTE